MNSDHIKDHRHSLDELGKSPHIPFAACNQNLVTDYETGSWNHSITQKGLRCMSVAETDSVSDHGIIAPRDAESPSHNVADVSAHSFATPSPKITQIEEDSCEFRDGPSKNTPKELVEQSSNFDLSEDVQESGKIEKLNSSNEICFGCVCCVSLHSLYQIN
jgi:hypothetical protein